MMKLRNTLQRNYLNETYKINKIPKCSAVFICLLDSLYLPYSLTDITFSYKNSPVKIMIKTQILFGKQ